MAIYKIFPNKDTTIYPDKPQINTGKDEILEIIPTDEGSSRFLIGFDQSEINGIYDFIPNKETFSAELKIFKAHLENINRESTIELHPVLKAWDTGTGRYGDVPYNKSGASWLNATVSSSWITPGGDFNPYISSSYEFNIGPYNYSSDLSFNVSGIIEGWAIGSTFDYTFDNTFQNEVPGNGFLFKVNDEEYNESIFKFYSRDTHTIYSPQLILKWDDSVYEVDDDDGVIDNRNFIMSINHKNFYSLDEIPVFDINVAERYPKRTFTTEFLYGHKHLPINAWYAIKDITTNEYVIPFDDDYTKISSRNGRSYFQLFLDGLQPERSYRVLVKILLNEGVFLFENPTSFKIKNY